MTSKLATLNAWVQEVAALTQPSHIHWCDGSAEENASLTQLMLDRGDLIALNADTHPDCYLHRSHPSDVARVEHLTFVCTKHQEDAGPNNNWMHPTEAHAEIDALFAGCMQGRTLYVVPYCMGPIDSPIARCGVEITDSPYVVANMRLMTRMGSAALARGSPVSRCRVMRRAWVNGRRRVTSIGCVNSRDRTKTAYREPSRKAWQASVGTSGNSGVRFPPVSLAGMVRTGASRRVTFTRSPAPSRFRISSPIHAGWARQAVPATVCA